MKIFAAGATRENQVVEGVKTMTEERRTLGALLRLPYEAMVKRMYLELAATGFSQVRPAHSAVFRHILPEGSRVTDLAERAPMTKQSMGYLVDSLHENGYVMFVPDPTDGRAKLARLTERGVAVQEFLVARGRHLEADLAEEIGAEEVAHLRRLLERLYVLLESDMA